MVTAKKALGQVPPEAMSGYTMGSHRGPGSSGGGYSAKGPGSSGGGGGSFAKTGFFSNKSGMSGSGSRIFTTQGYGSAGGPTIVDEERRLINKVFAIVDKDNSGTIDTKELKDMFKLFGLDSRVFDQTIEKTMHKIGGGGNNISADDFYSFLSQKFDKADVEGNKNDVKVVFNKMDGKGDGIVDVEELHKVANDLGENIPKAEIKLMIEMFSQEHQAKVKAFNKLPKDTRDKQKPPELEHGKGLTFDDFCEAVKIDLAGGKGTDASTR